VVAALAPPPASAPDPAPPQPDPKPKPQPKPDPEPQSAPEPAKPARPDPKPRKKTVASSGGNRAAAESEAAKGDKALRAFDTRTAQAAFESALKLDPALPGAHRGMGMVYVLLGRNAEAKSEYAKYLQLAPDAPDKDQIERLLAR
jgi:outer membrane biosynthesis protein TonB